MRILHSADWHLHPERPERFRVLEAIEAILERDPAEVVVLAGDLFDDPRAAYELRPELRRWFEALERPVLLIPGNHDEEAFCEGADFGQNVRVLGPEPVEQNGVLFDGLWFRSGRRAVRELDRLQARWAGAQTVVLVAHVSFYHRAPQWRNRELAQHEGLDWGRDCPLLAEDVLGRPIAYLALGHWHQHLSAQVGTTTVAYPGTPVPLNETELGPRYVALVELGPGSARLYARALEGVPEIRFLREYVYGNDSEALEKLDRLLRQGGEQVRLRLRVEGFLSGLERDFRSRLQELRSAHRGRWAEITIEFAPVQIPEPLKPLLESILGAEPSDPDPVVRLEEGLARWARELSREAVRRRALELVVGALLEGS
ncbi:MAG: metallophosphoesterase [Bacteroidota bacterium]|nr:metallophosphoesterase [Rhodothermia bacterium]MDW8285977.1 metallophosphoesterase [Bacteroidota bacterium]